MDKHHLKQFTLIKDFRDIKPFSVKFKAGLNIIVGENGSGKSSILKLLNDKLGYKDSYEIIADNVETRFLDTEKDNPRIKDMSHTENTQLYASCVLTHFKSHGESALNLIRSSRHFKNVILFIDEPEAGLSLKNQNKILSYFDKAVKNGCQIIVTTHSYVIINSVEEVFSMGSKKWIQAKKYLKENL